jgi:bla regulator protein blaR1
MSAPLALSLLLRLGAATTVFTLLAGLLVLARRALRARLGAGAVYVLWLMVPLGVALCCWPRHRAALPVPVFVVAVQGSGGTALAAGAAPAADGGPAQWILLAWLLGAAASAVVLLLRQRASWRALGPLRPGPDGTWISLRPDGGPALAGLPRSRIVLPAGFAERYDPAEQAAVLAHERLHARRGDLWWNALAALLECLFWFHPLAGPARRRYLADQELACDSAVLGSGLHARRAYANALLKTFTTASLPVGCTMQAISPIKERIMHLNDHRAPRRGRLAAAALACFTFAGAGLGWAATGEPAAASAGGYRLAIDLSVDGGAARHEEVLTQGAHRLAGLRDEEGRDCVADLALADAAHGTVSVQVLVVCGGKPAAAPRMIAKLGEPMTIAMGRTEKQADGSYVTAKGFRLSLKVDRA